MPFAVSIIIVNHNAGPLLTTCVEAVVHQVQQIVIVDNASTDASLENLMDCFSTDNYLQLIRLDQNLGFAAGCNIGLETVTTPYVLFLNPDCILAPDSLQDLLYVLESNPQAGMVGGQLINSDGTEQGGGRRTIPTPWRSFVRTFGLYRLEKFSPGLFLDFHLHRQPLPKEPVEVEAISGALMLVRREAINDVGNWDENYFLHCEDLDWCMRFRQKGWRIIFVPEVQVLHHQGACSRARPIFVAWHKHKGMLYFYKKFFRKQYPNVLMWIVILGVWLRFGVIAVFHAIRYIYQLLFPKSCK